MVGTRETLTVEKTSGAISCGQLPTFLEKIIPTPVLTDAWGTRARGRPNQQVPKEHDGSTTFSNDLGTQSL